MEIKCWIENLWCGWYWKILNWMILFFWFFIFPFVYDIPSNYLYKFSINIRAFQWMIFKFLLYICSIWLVRKLIESCKETHTFWIYGFCLHFFSFFFSNFNSKLNNLIRLMNLQSTIQIGCNSCFLPTQKLFRIHKVYSYTATQYNSISPNQSCGASKTYTRR